MKRALSAIAGLLLSVAALGAAPVVNNSNISGVGSGTVNAPQLGPGNLPSTVLSSAGQVLLDETNSVPVSNKTVDCATNTCILFTVGTGASSAGCSPTSVNVGATSNAATGQGGGSFLTGVSGLCAVTFTLPAVAHYWDCTAHDVTLQVNFVMTAASSTGCTISYPVQSGDLVTLHFEGA